MTQGIGASAVDRGWVGQLSERLRRDGWDHRVLNLSVTGARVHDVMDRQVPALDAISTREGRPALVTVVIGSNDVVSPRYRHGLAERFSTLLDHLPDGAVVMNLPNRLREAARVDDLLRAQAADGRIVLADMRREGPPSWRGLLGADSFHPNDRGYAVMADVVESALRRARA
jgi:lysophospholipase L1-like esterase